LNIARAGQLRDDAAMGWGSDRWVSVPVALLCLLTPLLAEAGYRFEDGVYLGDARLMADWADTLARADAQQGEIDACLAATDACATRLRGVAALLDRARTLSADRQLQLINRYINRRHYRRDRAGEVVSEITGDPVRLTSRWSTLVEFLNRGGDCEDYATSKYQLLRLLGMPAESLRVVVVYDRATREHHAVLAARRDDGDVWLLDSDDKIYRTRPFGYRFVYALNETSIWDHEADGGARSRSLPWEEAT
jgi:predicted transglutaminase-like cysteine proteinase